MKKKSTTHRKSHPGMLPQSEWNLPDTKNLELQYNYGNSVVAEFVSGHDHSAVLRELVQNEYDAGGSQLKVAFGTDELRISGNGNQIDSDGWERLSVMLGTGQVGGSERTVKQKVNGIGSKNFGLRALFLYGDRIHIRSGGSQTVLDFSGGTLQRPIPDPQSERLPGIEIAVPYRTQKRKDIVRFDIVQEKQALESFVTDLTPTVMKLAQPQSPNSLHLVEISSKRCGRSLVLKQSVRVISRQKGITAIRRTIHLTHSEPIDSRATGNTIEEIEFQKVISLPSQYRNQAIPGYYNIRGRIRLAVSLRKHRKRIDVVQPGYYYYPLRAPKAYTGNAVSINAPFEMNEDRSQIINPGMNEFNGWLIGRAVDLTFDLLVSEWWEQFGPERYLALEEQTYSENTYFSKKLTNRLNQDACWPTRAYEKRSAKRPQLAKAAEIVIPTYPELNGFLSDHCYLSDILGNNPRIQTMVKRCGAESFGINSLVRLRCTGSDKTKLTTKLASNEADYFYRNFPDQLKEENFQLKFAQTLDSLASLLSQPNREDLKKSPTTLAADGSLQAPENLWVVDSTIASVCPIPESKRLHPLLIECKALVKLCNKYDAKNWIQKAVQQVQDGTAFEELRTALYNFILKSHGNLDRKTWAMLRKTEVLRDHRNKWVKPMDITFRKAVRAQQLEAALHFPHPDYEHDIVLAEKLRFKNKVTGDDLVQYADIVATRPDLAPEFEETLQRFSRTLTKRELESLSKVAFLQSSQGNLAFPTALYLPTPRNLASLAGDAMFVIGSHTALYKRLGCMEQPKVEDILNYLSKLRLQSDKPNQPEILYPALVEALKARKLPTTSYQNHPIIWDGTGYSKPMDILLSRKYRPIFLQAIPQLEEGSSVLRQALKALGVPSDPQPQHWQQLFVWFGQGFIRSEEPLNQLKRQALLKAYGYFQKMPDDVSDDVKCLLDQNGRLHSLSEMRAKQYLLNDDPDLAEALMKKGTSISFAQTICPQQAKVLRFYHNVGIPLLTGSRVQIGYRIGAEKNPPAWCNTIEVIEKLHDRTFHSALTSLAAHQLQEFSDPHNPPIQQLLSARSLVFAEPIYIEYRVGSVPVEVATDVVIDHDRFVLTEAQSRNELYELLSQAIASLFVIIPAEQHRFANAVYRVLTCSSPSEVANYLRRQGISWEPPTYTLESESTYLDDEFSNFDMNLQIDSANSEVMPNDEALRNRQTIQEIMNSSIANQLSTSHITSNTTFSSDSNGRDNNLTSLTTREVTLPAIESVVPRLLAPLNGLAPQDSNAYGTGRKGYWTPLTFADEKYKNEVGQRGEEIIFLQEVERVKRLGYPVSRVVWIAKNNPLADCDILSVDENGEELWIEVKSTTGRDGRFQWSIAEFKKAMQVRERYILWRVYEADTVHPSIKPLRDPVGMIIRGDIQLDVASLYAEVEPLRVLD